MTLPTWPTSRPVDNTGALFVVAARRPVVGEVYGTHGRREACGGYVRWTWVPPEGAEPPGPGIGTCARCGATGWAWVDAWTAPAETVALEVASADVEDPNDQADAALPELSRADTEALEAFVDAADLSTPSARSSAWDAWLASDLRARLGSSIGPAASCLFARAVQRRAALRSAS